MNLLKQVFRDIVKEIGWVIFYGLLAMAVIVSFIYMSNTYDVTAAEADVFRTLEKNNITLVSVGKTKYKSSADKTPPVYEPSKVESMTEYFTSEFSPDGKAGSIVIMAGQLGYDNVVICLGAYADIMPCPVERTDPVTFAASYDTRDSKPDVIKVGWQEFPLHLAQKEMKIIHPAYYQMNSKDGQLDNTLYVYSEDYTAFKELFPSSVYWDLSVDRILGIFILKDAESEDILRLRNVVSKNSGAFVYAESVYEYIGSSAVDSDMRTAKIKLLYYIVSSVTLLGAMLINIYRTIKRKKNEYAVHYIFGASDQFIFARMFLFALLYHIIPIIGTVAVLTNELNITLEYFGNTGKAVMSLAVTVLVILAVLFTVSFISFTQFRKSFSEGRKE